MKITLSQAEMQRNYAGGKLSTAIHGEDLFERARALEALAATMREQGAFSLSHQLLEQAFRIDPESGAVRRSLGLSRCRMGHLAAGLELYDSGRWQLDSFASIKRPFAQTEWQGEHLQGKSILLWAEQGVGDQIMQARCLKWILEQNPRQVIVECDPRLAKLIECSFPGVKTAAQLVEPDVALLEAKFDYQSSLFSAWRWTYARDLEIGQRGYPGYLNFDTCFRDEFQKVWRKKNWKYNVGISWRSSSKVTGDRKSIPPGEWAPLLDNREIQFHNLQYDCDTAELDRLVPEFGRRLLEDRGGDPKRKLYRLAAQIAALDLVISVDNTTVHIAGAVGTPCITLLPKNSDWRWGCEGEDTFLYESMTLLRQNDSRTWLDVILRAGLLLREAKRKGF